MHMPIPNSPNERRRARVCGLSSPRDDNAGHEARLAVLLVMATFLRIRMAFAALVHMPCCLFYYSILATYIL